jgi:hypothetical protein
VLVHNLAIVSAEPRVEHGERAESLPVLIHMGDFLPVRHVL